ncbi:TPA: hypothetical protein ACG3DQ_001567 [Pseudomonas putida]
MIDIHISTTALHKAHISPAMRSEACGDTRQLALVQTISARQALYQPGEALKNELSHAAGKLYQAYGSLENSDQQALGARLFSSEGLMTGQTPNDLLQILRRVDECPDYASGHDRAVVIATMGDIGALYAATGATTGTDRTADASARLRESLRDALAVAGLIPPTEESSRRVQQEGGSTAVGPDKKTERSRPSAEHIDRTGIHNLGEEADEVLGVPIEDRISTSRWDVAYIDFDRVADTVEPLVGHMSGSPAEILQIWDMLSGNQLEYQFLPPYQQEQQLARAAGASAFLVGLGYHSAVEVLEGTLRYTGQSIRHDEILSAGQKDAGYLFGEGAATDLMSEFFQAHTRQM